MCEFCLGNCYRDINEYYELQITMYFSKYKELENLILLKLSKILRNFIALLILSFADIDEINYGIKTTRILNNTVYVF